MSAPLIYLDRDGDLNLQNQLRQKLVDAILAGSLPPGRRLPSSRQLATQLDVARNTVVLAYQQLSAEGYLVSRERSGVYVNERIVQGAGSLRARHCRQRHGQRFPLAQAAQGQSAAATPFPRPAELAAISLSVHRRAFRQLTLPRGRVA